MRWLSSSACSTKLHKHNPQAPYRSMGCSCVKKPELHQVVHKGSLENLRARSLIGQHISSNRMAAQRCSHRKVLNVNVSEVKVSGNRMQRIRLIVVTSLLLTLPGLMVAQSSMQTINSVAEGQTGSQSAGAALEGSISDPQGRPIA